jgi:hypothetical protein
MEEEGKTGFPPAINSRRRLIRWYDDARNKREAARQTGTGRQAIAEITAELHRDILPGAGRHLIHRIPIPGAESAEETVYLFPDHRAIHEIRIPPLFFRPMTHWIAFIECDRDAAESQPGDQDVIETKL